MIHIKCDDPGCGWDANEPVAEVGKWHKTPCPRCGNGVILSDADMGVLAGIVALVDSGLASFDLDAPESVQVHVDTARLRAASDMAVVYADSVCNDKETK